MSTRVEHLQELVVAKSRGEQPDGCCALFSLSTCTNCTFTCDQGTF
ncbi:hypothetical protein ACWDA3_61130 [Nonomuraea rubra]